jgi:hypothetical protein
MILYESTRAASRRGSKAGAAIFVAHFVSWRAGVMQDVIRSRPDLVLAGGRSPARNLFGHGKSLTLAWRHRILNRTRGDIAMQPNDAGFLLNDSGRRLAMDVLPQAQELGLDNKSDLIDHAIRQRGFVLIQPAHRAIFVELCPSKVAPLAALEAFYEVKGTAAECIVLAYPGDPWECPRCKLFSSIKAALRNIEIVARAASRRAAAKINERPHSKGDPARLKGHAGEVDPGFGTRGIVGAGAVPSW